MYRDIEDLHEKFKKLGAIQEYSSKTMLERVSFIQEETQELIDAICKDDQEEVLDALVDLCVVAMGSAWWSGYDFESAWNEVHKANMAKEAVEGQIKAERNMQYDLNKPEGWEKPNLKRFV